MNALSLSQLGKGLLRKPGGSKRLRRSDFKYICHAQSDDKATQSLVHATSRVVTLARRSLPHLTRPRHVKVDLTILSLYNSEPRSEYGRS